MTQRPSPRRPSHGLALPLLRRLPARLVPALLVPTLLVPALFVPACGSSTSTSGAGATGAPTPTPDTTDPRALHGDPDGQGEARPTTPAAETEVDPRTPRVVLSLAEHPERAERWHWATRLVDLGEPSGEQFTLGGWTTGLRSEGVEDPSGASVSVALAGGHRSKLAVPVDAAGPLRVTLRARGFRGSSLSAALDDSSVPVHILDEQSGAALTRLPVDGSFALLQLDLAQVSAGEHTLTLRVRGGAGTHEGRSASLALDWMRWGDPADRGAALHTAPASHVGVVGDQPKLELGAHESVAYTLRLPTDGRLRGVLRSGGAELRVSVEGQQPQSLGNLAEGAFDVDLAPLARHGGLARVQIKAGEAGAELVRPSVVVLEEPAPRAEVRRPRNVLLYLVDTLRADHLSPYNRETRVRTPGLATFVRDAVTMRRAHSQENWTKPSVATLLSSLMPWEHTAVQDSSVVPSSVQLLPELLREQGFFTGSFIANGYVSDRFGFDQGWHTYRNYIREGRRSQAEFVAADALTWLDEREDTRPFFLYVHTIDPHVPYRRREDTFALYGDTSYRGPAAVANNADLLGRIKLGRVSLDTPDRQHLEALYDGEITYHDVHFQAIMDGLERRHLADDTLVIITSDHGEEFWDHGSVGHGHSVYEELLHVPMFVRHPGLPASRTSVRELGDDVGLVDVLPTIFEALGLPIPEGVSGRSFMPALLGEASSAPPATVSGFMENWRTVTLHDLKLIHRANGTYRLFDLAADPHEQHDIAAERPLAVRHLRALLGLRLADADPVASPRARRERTRARRASTSHQSERTVIDDETAAQLRALGYLIE